MVANNWYWFGVLVAGTAVKLRQYHVQFREGRWWIESWAKGISGSLWYCRLVNTAKTFEDALAIARAEIAERAAGYVLVDEGEPITAEPPKNEPHGGADADWWADVLAVSPSADEKTVKSAFRRRAIETHPDKTGGDDSEIKQVIAAWEYIKNLRGW